MRMPHARSPHWADGTQCTTTTGRGLGFGQSCEEVVAENCLREGLGDAADAPADGGVGAPQRRSASLAHLISATPAHLSALATGGPQPDKLPGGRACCPTASCLRQLKGQVSNPGWQLEREGSSSSSGSVPWNGGVGRFHPAKKTGEGNFAGPSTRHGMSLEKRHTSATPAGGRMQGCSHTLVSSRQFSPGGLQWCVVWGTQGI
ncbi:hypothetical protein B0T16DRAFT_133913 [Cercophora newfieldiana]|uniref:Uncharacterized protein n=1 Tax=Cercophora newfieldiana TaxID=92897 RepID=A0AA39YC51_9PEZI|nr:hypothetical protein B0T16DRAFT_133913 [Cercophora newfieldiana]